EEIFEEVSDPDGVGAHIFLHELTVDHLVQDVAIRQAVVGLKAGLPGQCRHVRSFAKVVILDHSSLGFSVSSLSSSNGSKSTHSFLSTRRPVTPSLATMYKTAPFLSSATMSSSR